MKDKIIVSAKMDDTLKENGLYLVFVKIKHGYEEWMVILEAKNMDIAATTAMGIVKRQNYLQDTDELTWKGHLIQGMELPYIRFIGE